MRRLPGLARYHGVAGCVYASLRHLPGVPSELLGVLKRQHQQILRMHLRVLGDLAHVKQVLDPTAVPWLVVKGPVVAEVLYRHPALRAYSDLDLVVLPDAFPVVVDILERSGLAVLDRNWARIRRELRGQIHLRLRYGTTGDLHWHLLNRDRAAFTISMESLFERARRVSVNGAEVCTLDAVDTLVHLAVHACLGGGDRLLWLKDLEQSVLNDAPEWDEVVDRATAWRAGPLVATMLRRARGILSLPVPTDVLHSLAPSRSQHAVLALADLLAPPQRSTGRPSPSRLVASTTRADVRSCARALSRHLAQPLLRRRDAVLRVAGDESDRAAFLAAVGGIARHPSEAEILSPRAGQARDPTRRDS